MIKARSLREGVIREGSRSLVDVGAVTYGRTPPLPGGWHVAAGWGGVRWLTVFLVGVGLALAGWVTFGSPQADAQTLMLLDEADCDHPSGIHLPDGYASLDTNIQPAVVADCKALVSIRNHFLFGADGTETLNRTHLTVPSWGTGASTQIDDWNWVTFDSTGRVERIRLVPSPNFPTNQLSGTIPPAIGDLTNLGRLWLGGNMLTGSIPDLSALTNLQEVRLTNNMLSGSIPDLSALTNLRLLWLFRNMLTGPIPDLSALTNLTDLQLHNNMLTGITNLSGLSSLTRLWLNDNMLSGPIPDLSDLALVTNLDLDNNMLDGSIPDLSSLTSLTRLRLANNRLSGSIPDLSSLTSLITLDLRNNMLDGSIPDLSSLTSLQELRLNDNRLSGSIPDLSALTGLRNLWLWNNRLSGSIPDLSALTSLPDLNLSNNMLSGQIPATLNSLTGLTVLNLSNNMLSGSIPDLSALTGLVVLNLSNNMLTGTIPDLSALYNVEVLNLSNNMLTGQIPATLWELTTASLLDLFLESNDLEGTVPDSVGGGFVLQNLRVCGNPRLMADPSALEDNLGLVAYSPSAVHWNGSLCTGPAPVVQVLTPEDGQVAISWTFDGPPVSHFLYRTIPLPRDSEISSYSEYGWREVPGGASANTFTATMVTEDPYRIGDTGFPLPTNLRGTPLVTGQTYEIWLQAVYPGDTGTSLWQVEVTAAVESPSEVVIGDAESVVEGGKLVFPVEVPDGVSGSFLFRATWDGSAWPGSDFEVVSVRERGVTRLEDGWFRMTVESGGDFSIELQTRVDGTVEPIERAVLEVVGEEGLTVTDMRGSDRPRGDIMDVGSPVIVEGAQATLEGQQMRFPVIVPPDMTGSFIITVLNRDPRYYPDAEPLAKHGTDFTFDSSSVTPDLSSVNRRGEVRRWRKTVNGENTDILVNINTDDKADEPDLRLVLILTGENGLPVRGRDPNESLGPKASGFIREAPPGTMNSELAPDTINGEADTGDGESDAETTTMDEESTPDAVGGDGDEDTDSTTMDGESTPDAVGGESDVDTDTMDGESDTTTMDGESDPDAVGGEGDDTMNGDRDPGSGPEDDPTNTGGESDTPPTNGNEEDDEGDTSEGGSTPPESTPDNPGGSGGSGAVPTNTGGGGGGAVPTNNGGSSTPTGSGGGSAPLDPGCRPGEFVGMFCDEDGSVHEANIEMLAGWKITLGCRENQFCPQDSISRSQMAAFLYRAVSRHSGTPPAGSAVLPDVAAGAWYRPFAQWSVTTGVMSMVDGGFSPGSVVTRADMAVMLAAAFPDLIQQGEVTGMFTDTAGLDDATIRAMEGLHRAGVTLGCSTAPLRYCPDQPVTRAQMASFFVRALTQPPN